ncbi:sirA-like family protein [Asticcacaulis biprosthecium C19]|uniref:SirA-like family protein n=1 Tax=Asticcacaulis biprosthecium C19 TaxID=715226 RepID=F4QQU2_9CAUL|nr:sulfurtransferase TusA family protein [Asticcacaulis biprosthecium]EGF90579.1 sirA-like family protein [Asticcacaulis biprosthecium C19]
MTPDEPETIDARGHRCPVPTLKLRRHLAQQPAGARVVLLADDPMAQIDVPHFCNQNNYFLRSVEVVADGWRFEICCAD